MANIDVGGGRSGRKAVDAAMPLIPILDLLLCCLMFLLVTAVWNELGSMNASLNTPGRGAADSIDSNARKLSLLLSASGYELSSSWGDRVAIPRVASQLDVAALRERIGRYAQQDGDRPITISADDGIPLSAVVEAMDVVRESGFTVIQL